MDVDRFGSYDFECPNHCNYSEGGSFDLFLALCVRQGLGQGASTIILGPIEGELEKKQIALIWVRPPSQSFLSFPRQLRFMAVCALPHPKQSQVSCSFSLIDGNRISVGLSKGNPKQKMKELSADGSSLEASVLSACDRMVEALWALRAFSRDNSVSFRTFPAKRKSSLRIP